MFYELNHVGIVVRDLDASLDFYRGVLGAEVVFRSVIPATSTDVVYLQIHRGLIELLHQAEPPVDETFGVTHVAFLTDRLDEDFARVVTAGCTPLVPPRIAGTGVGRLAFVGDPNGTRVELLERDLPMRREPVPHPVVRSFDHYSIAAPDLAAAGDFYRDQLGLQRLGSLRQEGGDLRLDYLHHGYDVLELRHSSAAASEPAFHHIAFRVDDAAEAVAALSERGARVSTPAQPAAAGPGRVAAIADPDGVRIVLVEVPADHPLRRDPR